MFFGNNDDDFIKEREGEKREHVSLSVAPCPLTCGSRRHARKIASPMALGLCAGACSTGERDNFSAGAAEKY